MYVKRMRPYISRFPNEFLSKFYKIYDWPYKGWFNKKTAGVGKFINKIYLTRLSA